MDVAIAGPDDGIDLAVVAFRDADGWQVDDLVHEKLTDIHSIAHALRRLPGDVALGLVGGDEDFFLLVRVDGDSTRVLLSDVSAADEWDLAGSALDFLNLPDLDEDDDDGGPAGDLGLLTDLGILAADLAELVDDDEPFPDETLSEIADQLGFGELFDDWVGLAPV